MAQNIFSAMELDAIGEMMNISLGSSATAVSNLLDHRVDITTPKVTVVPISEFTLGELEPAIGVEIKYVSGLEGSNIMLLKRSDVKAIVELLMGTEIPEEEFELNELTISAVCELMNQMMGAASTALSDFLGRPVNISTPQSFSLDDLEEIKRERFHSETGMLVAVHFMGLVAGAAHTGLQDNLSGLVLEMLKTFLFAAGPLLATTAVVAVAATFFQTKLLVSGEALKPKFSRINPLQGIKRLFSLRSVIEALKGILKITVLLFLIYQFLVGIVDTFTKYLHTDLAVACAHLVDEGFQMVMQIAIAFVVLAGADVFYQWWDYERQLRMSKQEIKEEYKQMEGDPQVKGKIKEVQRRMAQSRMMQQVPKADVVIRNPTHFAVALRYRPETDGAPIVLAKGQDELAGRIVRKAEEHHIAIIENVPLARALYATAELNREIPPELYNAVAEVLVYLYRMDEKLK